MTTPVPPAHDEPTRTHPLRSTFALVTVLVLFALVLMAGCSAIAFTWRTR